MTEKGGGELVPVSFRIPKALRDLIRRYLVMSTYATESEFFREALREKLRNDVPRLYEGLMSQMEAR